MPVLSQIKLVNEPTTNPPARRICIKVCLAATCITGAFALAVFFKQSTRPPVATAPPPASAEDVLAAIPPPLGTSAGEKAVVDATAKVRHSPDKADLWANLGDALSQRQRDSSDPVYYDLAGRIYQQALLMDPRNVSALNGMAWVTGGRHLFEESIAWANKSIAISPENADAEGILGDAALELGNYDEAFVHYQKMMDLRPDLSSWSRGAYLLWVTGHTNQAANLMQRAIGAGGGYAENTAWCRAKLATMDYNQGSFAAAAQVLEPSLRERSKNPHILLAAARIATATGDLDVAEQYYKLLLEKGPNHDALAGLGDLHASKGEKEEAEKYYLQVEALHAVHLATAGHDHLQMALFFADHDRNPVEAMRLAEQRKLTRNVFEADALAWVYFKNGENTKAIDAIKLALSQHTPDSRIHYHAGCIAAKAGDMESARRHLQTALALNPSFSILQAPAATRLLEQISGAKAPASNPPPAEPYVGAEK